MQENHIATSSYFDELLHRLAAAFAIVFAIFILLMVCQSLVAQDRARSAIVRWCKTTPGCAVRADSNSKVIVVPAANEAQARDVLRANFVSPASSLFNFDPFVFEVRAPNKDKAGGSKQLPKK